MFLFSLVIKIIGLFTVWTDEFLPVGIKIALFYVDSNREENNETNQKPGKTKPTMKNQDWGTLGKRENLWGACF